MKFKLNRGLIKGGITLLIAFGFYNLFNFLYQFSMARMLTVSDYGILAAIFSLIYILSAFTESIQIIITKYSSGEGDGRLKNILKRSLRKAGYLSLFIFFIYLGLSFFISDLMNIEYSLLAISGFIIFTSVLSPVTRGVFQGQKRFFSLGLNMIFDSGIKLLVGIFFVFLGWRVYGALTGVLIGSVVAFGFSLIGLKDVFSVTEKRIETKDIYTYAGPAFFVIFLVVIFYSLDVLMAKALFSEEMAGSYALASILGKIIFWGTMPIGKAMFPMTSDKKQEKKKNIFINSVGIVVLGIIILLAASYFFPGSTIKVFSGKDVPEAASVLFFVGAGMGLISLANLILLYGLSLGKFKGIFLLVTFIFIEIFLLSFFSGSLMEFSLAFVVASALFLIGSLVFLLKNKSKHI